MVTRAARAILRSRAGGEDRGLRAGTHRSSHRWFSLFKPTTVWKHRMMPSTVLDHVRTASGGTSPRHGTDGDHAT